MVTKKNIDEKIKRILTEEIICKPLPEDFTNESPLVDALNLDSIWELNLLVKLEKEFGFSIDEEDLVPELFATLNSLLEYVEKKIYGQENYKNDK
ncbi:MAG: phosphopantetheine-binding protein [Thermodesulfobacteriota bacterium]|nr:phosphopantetheine-binding protein [Thermodesulfobacteriota bacterium]